MAVNEKNFAWFTYVDDDAREWNIRGESGGAGDPVDGHATFDGANPVFGRVSNARHPRYVIARNPTTRRTVKFIVYTAAAFTAIAGGDSISVSVPGLVTAETYNVAQKVKEKIPLPSAGVHLIDG